MEIDNLNIIQNLTAEKEGGKVEFKQTTGQLERGMETLCAFLNGEGGTVLFGVADNGKIIGQEVSDKTKRDIAEAIGRLEPTATVQVSYVPLPDGEKKIIALHVEDSRMERPFTYKNRPYMRVESTTVAMPQQKYNELLLDRDGVRHRWELFDDPDLTLNDIDENEVLKTVRLGIDCGRLPENTGKVIGGGPMMGKALMNLDVPVCKGSSGLLLMSERESRRAEPQPCIRCAKCVSACPMGLEPYLLATASALRNWELAEENDITSCIECGSCQFTCPSTRPMLDNIRMGKTTVMALIRARNAK